MLYLHFFTIRVRVCVCVGVNQSNFMMVVWQETVKCLLKSPIVSAINALLAHSCANFMTSIGSDSIENVKKMTMKCISTTHNDDITDTFILYVWQVKQAFVIILTSGVFVINLWQRQCLLYTSFYWDISVSS